MVPDRGHLLDKMTLKIRAAKDAAMNISKLLNSSVMLSSPPPGSINVRLGKKVEGPGGKWVPCATEVASGVYVSAVFEVGPGRRQVCAAGHPVRSPDEALSRAVTLACTAAA